MELSDNESEERDDVTDVSKKCENCAKKLLTKVLFFFTIEKRRRNE